MHVVQTPEMDSGLLQGAENDISGAQGMQQQQHTCSNADAAAQQPAAAGDQTDFKRQVITGVGGRL